MYRWRLVHVLEVVVVMSECRCSGGYDFKTKIRWKKLCEACAISLLDKADRLPAMPHPLTRSVSRAQALVAYYDDLVVGGCHPAIARRRTAKYGSTL